MAWWDPVGKGAHFERGKRRKERYHRLFFIHIPHIFIVCSLTSYRDIDDNHKTPNQACGLAIILLEKGPKWDTFCYKSF